MFKSNKTILWICIFFVFNCVNSQDSNEGYNQDYVDDDGSFEGQGYAGT